MSGDVVTCKSYGHCATPFLRLFIILFPASFSTSLGLLYFSLYSIFTVESVSVPMVTSLSLSYSLLPVFPFLYSTGKSTLLRIMSGEDTEIDGLARPLPGASIGFLKQEPELEGSTVEEAIEPALAKARKVLEDFGELSAKLGE